VARVLAGEAEAYRPLVERYQRAVLGLAARLLGRAAMRGSRPGGLRPRLRYLPTLKEPNRFGPWLYQVVRSLSRDRNRRKDAERRPWSAAGRPPLGDCAQRRRDRLGALPPAPTEYQVLRMRYFEGMSYEEIARQRSMTFSQVDHLIRKAGTGSPAISRGSANVSGACKEHLEDLPLYAEGELDPLRERVLRIHLAGCPGCRDWLAGTTT